jgi:N-acetylglucosamine-6-phosphate deacetylase
MSTILENARILTPGGVVEGWVEVDGGTIKAVGQGQPPAGASGARENIDGAWLAPGFVDIHVHGGGSAWLSSTDPEELRKAVDFHVGHGTTTLLASLVTAPLEAMVASIRSVVGAMRGPLGPTLAGVHLEGPFLCRAACGAQDPDAILEPDAEALGRLLAAGQGEIRTVTIAPERPGALELIAQIARAGANPSIGHTEAKAAQTTAGLCAGARLATHLFNAMKGLHHREPGAVGALLSDDQVICELINDGIHVAPEAVRVAFRAAGAHRIALITDAIAAAGMADGEYMLGRVPVRVKDGVARTLATDALAGSTLTMDDAVRRAVVDVGLPLADVVTAASATPARAIGVYDRVGSIEVGKAADFVVLNDRIERIRVMTRGRWVHSAA